ncbi:DUF3784 domain-containing protein [Mangrovibacillus cuniculi]|uniref:DUF3784 domain-containing protein n=1 Tax=Mangrovibacillus cuniculi TaxID=2593652 RepID=A0A7S8CCU2_9BACI|nr:DUF3784 domain-containing protein [Mangrovibacillus cuniculi]QPC47619.1 DUF3784 domain-containing protein [Mangrovibacillus cuniculi]
MIGAIINFILSMLFLLLGLFLAKGKGAFLIAGYNTLPAKVKAKYNEQAVCTYMSKVMYGLSFSVFLWGMSVVLEVTLLFIIGTVLFVSILIFTVVYTNTGERFKRN